MTSKSLSFSLHKVTWYLLSLRYEEGYGTKKDENEANIWRVKALSNGGEAKIHKLAKEVEDTAAQYIMGHIASKKQDVQTQLDW